MSDFFERIFWAIDDALQDAIVQGFAAVVVVLSVGFGLHILGIL